MVSETCSGAGCSVAVIIVTYASDRVLPLCLKALATQTRQPDLIVIVDNNSPNPAYLDDITMRGTVTVIRNRENEGFCAANNTGYRLAREHKYILFLNPDAFPQTDLIERGIEWLEKPVNSRVAVLTASLLGFDLNAQRPNGKIDSTGIFQTWYGRWYDRGQGEPWVEPAGPASPEALPAICGAMMLCRTEALESALLSGSQVFDQRFFMYKEDIDLSLRLRRRQWKLIYLANLICFHCRGWQDRSRMSDRARYLSARNELRLCLGNHGKGLPYSLLKFLFVLAEGGWIKLTRKIKVPNGH